jgi:hypothetical protein
MVPTNGPAPIVSNEEGAMKCAPTSCITRKDEIHEVCILRELQDDVKNESRVQQPERLPRLGIRS